MWSSPKVCVVSKKQQLIWLGEWFTARYFTVLSSSYQGCLRVLFYFQAHVVMDVTRQQSKGYGFATFPCRRSTELAMIWWVVVFNFWTLLKIIFEPVQIFQRTLSRHCFSINGWLLFSFNSMQGFEISGRAMQLGWGQENKDEKLLSAEGSRSKLIQEQQHAQVRFERVKSLRTR